MVDDDIGGYGLKHARKMDSSVWVCYQESIQRGSDGVVVSPLDLVHHQVAYPIPHLDRIREGTKRRPPRDWDLELVFSSGHVALFWGGGQVWLFIMVICGGGGGVICGGSGGGVHGSGGVVGHLRGDGGSGSVIMNVFNRQLRGGLRLQMTVR